MTSNGQTENEQTNKWIKNGFGGNGTIRTGKYSAEETEAVKIAVVGYCAFKQISVARLCSECDHKAELKGAWMEIAKRLPHRSVQSVYRHGLRQLHPFKRGTWSEDEVQILIGSVAQYGKKWATIQTKLNRSADSCRDKYREIDDMFVRGRWKENETEQLKRLIREYLRVDPRADIKALGKMVDTERIKIPWSVISKQMGKRSRLSCFKKWQKMTGLFSPSDSSSSQRQQQQQQSTTTTGARDSSRARAGVVSTTSQHQQIEVGAVMLKSSGGDVGRINHSYNQQHRHHHVAPTLCSGHHAPTAGAAAANAIAMGLSGKSKIHSNSRVVAEDVKANSSEQQEESATAAAAEQDMDVYLLSELISFGVHRATDVAWEDLRSSDNAQERWYELLDEWQLSVMDDSLLALPISEVAQLILERKTSAQRAAETVEAVDLPPVPESL